MTLGLTGCKSTPEYIYVQPECPIIANKTLSEVDAGVLWDVLTLPHSLDIETLNSVPVELPEGYDGYALYWTLKTNQTLLVDMILEQRAVLQQVCKPRNN
jgi:hypothetical protein